MIKRFENFWINFKVKFGIGYENVYPIVMLAQIGLLLWVAAQGMNFPARVILFVCTIIFGAAFIAGVGEFAIRRGMYEKETSLRNKHNAEMREMRRLLEERK